MGEQPEACPGPEEEEEEVLKLGRPTCFWRKQTLGHQLQPRHTTRLGLTVTQSPRVRAGSLSDVGPTPQSLTNLVTPSPVAVPVPTVVARPPQEHPSPAAYFMLRLRPRLWLGIKQ